MENRDYIVAIDLGTSTVSAVVGYRGDGGQITVVDCATVEVEGMVRSEIKNIEQVVSGIKSVVELLEERQNIKIRDVYTGISGQHIRCVKYPYYVFVGRDGEIRDEDVRKLHESMNNVQAPEGEMIIQIIPQSYLVDGEETSSPVGAFGNKLEATFNFILGDSNVASRLKRALTRVDLKQVGVFVNAIASAEAVTTEDEREEGVVVVDLGAGMTDVTIFHKNIIRHVVIIPIGGNVINRDIRSYGILERHIENLKVKYGSALRDRVKHNISITTPGLNSRVTKEISTLNLAAIIEARMLDIVEFVMTEVEQAGYKNKLAAGIVITGGGAQLSDLDELFKVNTGMDVRVADPDLGEGSVMEAKSPSYATAVGILKKGVESGVEAKAERFRPVRPLRVEEPIEPVETPGPIKRTLNDRFKRDKPVEKVDDPQDEVDDFDDGDDDNDGGAKGGIFGKLKRKINGFFDVIDDNEI